MKLVKYTWDKLLILFSNITALEMEKQQSNKNKKVTKQNDNKNQKEYSFLCLYRLPNSKHEFKKDGKKRRKKRGKKRR